MDSFTNQHAQTTKLLDSWICVMNVGTIKRKKFNFYAISGIFLELFQFEPFRFLFEEQMLVL